MTQDPSTGDHQSAATLSKLIELSRGVHHGIALGDAADHLTSSAPSWPTGVASQLTLATTEGMVRAMERAGQGLGIDWGHENLEALRRWATAQQIPGVPGNRTGSPSVLTRSPAFGVRRGNAPATVRSLRSGLPSGPGHGSLGAHALVRTLPFGVLLALHGPSLTWPVGELVGTTHTHPLAAPTAALGALLVAQAADRSVPLGEGWVALLEHHAPEGGDLVTQRVGAAITTAVVEPRSPSRVADLAPDRSAASALAAAVYVVLSHPEPDELPLAMALASFSPEKHGTSAVVGGLLGARHGSTPMLVHGATRLELAWACDALATDLAMTAMLTPLAKEPSGEPWLPSWGVRYLV